jgi:hemoglobin
MCNGQRSNANTPSHCGCSGGQTPSRVVDAATELILPPMTYPSSHVIEIAGAEKLRELTRRHHALLQAGPIAGLFPADPWAFARLAEKVADFIVEACGGPASYSEHRGDTCMRTRHFPFSIDEAAREIWLAALYQAMEDVAFPVDVREEYWNWLEAFSVRMINRRTIQAQPVRIPFVLAQLRFANPAASGQLCGIRIRFCPH